MKSKRIPLPKRNAKRKRETKQQMGEMHENKTAKEVCEMLGEKPDTIRMRLNALRESGNTAFADVRWSLSLPLSPAQIALLEQSAASKSKKVKPIVLAETTAGKKVEMCLPKPPANERGAKVYFQNWRIRLFTAMAFSLVIGHAGLIWFDLTTLWSVAGQIGGGVVFLFIFSGMVLMSEKSPKMAEIRENMMWAITLLEALAIVVHRAAFYGHATNAYAAGLGNEYIWALSAVICLCSIGATIFYQKVVSQ